jgi:hypothetical protein
VRIGRNHERDAGLLGALAVDVRQIQAIGVRVDFQADAVLGASLEHLVEVQLDRLACADLPAERMRHAIDHAASDGPEHALRHLLLGKLELRVHGSVDPVQFGEQVLIQIQVAVLEDVDLDARQQSEALEPPVHFANRVGVFSQAVFVQPVGHMHRL